jgi:hypothetical protein
MWNNDYVLALRVFDSLKEQAIILMLKLSLKLIQKKILKNNTERMTLNLSLGVRVIVSLKNHHIKESTTG